MIKGKIWTEKAIKVINKKLRNKSLSQQDSNYLSRFVRPKLREIASIDAPFLLKKLEYNPKALSIERKIKKIILKEIHNVDSIIICGSAVQTNYKEYNDLDLIVATKKILAHNLREKNKIIKKTEEAAKKQSLNLDIQIYSKKSILSQYKYSPSLIYQLKDSKIIYGGIKIPKKISLSSLDLRMKLDWSEGLNSRSEPSEIYIAIRNAMLVLLLMNKKIDNYQLKNNLLILLGNDLINNLKDNKASNIEIKIALNYLNSLVKYLNNELKKSKWEKIDIENH